MRKFVFTITFFCFCFGVNAQKIIKGNYIFNKNGVDYNLNKSKDGKTQEVIKDYKIVVDSVDTNTVYYRYLEVKDSTTNNRLKNKIFELPLEDFKKTTNPRYPIVKGFSVGGLVIPIRMRGSDDTFTFENDLSLGVNLLLGIGKVRSPNSYVDCSLGFSITKINLSSDNSAVSESRTASALTFSSGLIFKLDQFFKSPYIAKNPINVGFFAGFDSLGATDLKAGWIYNKQLWIGIGLNVGISPVATNSGVTSKN